MAQNALVSDRINDAGQFVRDFAVAKLGAENAFWLKMSDEESWHLYLVTKDVDERGLRHVYGGVVQAIRDGMAATLGISDVKVISPAEELARQIARFSASTDSPGLSPIHIGTPSLSRFDIEEGYVYPPVWFRKRASASPADQASPGENGPGAERQIIRRGEMLAESFLEDLEPDYIARATDDKFLYDFVIGFANSEDGVNLCGVEVKATESIPDGGFELPTATLERLAHANIPSLLLVIDVRRGEVFTSWPADHRPPCAMGEAFRVPVVLADESVKAALRTRIAGPPT